MKFSKVLIGLLFVFVVIGLAFAGQAPKDTYVLKAKPMADVTFNHKVHATQKCDTCHHASKPQKANTSAQQACTDCHTNPATAPVTTSNPFHAKGGQKGVCIDCHKQTLASNASAKVPKSCTDCHKKA